MPYLFLLGLAGLVAIGMNRKIEAPTYGLAGVLILGLHVGVVAWMYSRRGEVESKRVYDKPKSAASLRERHRWNSLRTSSEHLRA